MRRLTTFTLYACAAAAGVYLVGDHFRALTAVKKQNLEQTLSMRTEVGSWQFGRCVDQIRVDGLGMQTRRSPRKFISRSPNGEERIAHSFDNHARKTRLDMIEVDGGLIVNFYTPPGRELRAGERRHLMECIGQTR